MARRARSRGGAPAKEPRHKQRDPSSKSPHRSQGVAEAELETIFDALGEAFLNSDTEQINEIMTGQLAIAHPSAPSVLVKRLIEGREPVPGIALMILGDIAQENGPKHLRKIADAREAPDLTRIEARRLLRWPEGTDEERIAFLDSLSDADGALAQLASTAGYAWPTRPFILSEVLGYLRAVPSTRRQAVMARTIDDDGPAAIPLLHSLLHDDDSDTQIAAIETLEGFRFAGSVGPLQRLASTASQPETRERALTALRDRDFSLQEIPYTDDELAPFPGEDLGVPTQAMLSSVSYTGDQSVLILREMTDEIADGVGFFMDDRIGLQEVFPLMPNSRDAVVQEMYLATGSTSEQVDISPEAARGALALTIDFMAERSLPLSPEFEVWEPFLHETYPPAPDEPVTLPIIDESAYAGRHDLVERGTELYEKTEFFIGWTFDEQSTEAFMERVELPRSDDWTSDHYRTVLSELATPEILSALRGRLRKQAYLLDVAGMPEMKDIALAVAASLNNATLDDLTNNAFMLEMALLSIDMMRNPFFGMDDADSEIDPERENFDPQAMIEALESLGLTPEDVLKSLGLQPQDPSSDNSIDYLLRPPR